MSQNVFSRKAHGLTFTFLIIIFYLHFHRTILPSYFPTIKKVPTAIMAMSATLYSDQTTLNIFLLCFSFPSFTPFNFSCSLRADSTSFILAISAAASSIPK